MGIAQEKVPYLREITAKNVTLLQKVDELKTDIVANIPRKTVHISLDEKDKYQTKVKIMDQMIGKLIWEVSR